MNLPPSTWTVTGQLQTTQPDPAGRFVTGVLVSFTTGKGFSGSVFVPEAQYSVANVQAAIAAKAQQLDAVGSLTG
jgi:hypothetical protein